MINKENKPVHEVRIGAIRAAIWKNDTQNGVRYNATFSRLYKDGEEWKDSDSFGREDLLALAKVADQSHTWMIAQVQEGMEERRNHSRGEGLSQRDPAGGYRQPNRQR